MPLVTVASGAKVWVEEKGEGKPILFVHGWPLSGIPWQSQLDGLSAEHHVLTIDLPGFGRSPPLEETVTIKGLATAVRDMLDARDLTDVFMIGWSMGGGVIFSYFEHFGSHRLRAAGVVDDVAMLLPGDDWLHGVDTPWSMADLDDWRARVHTDLEGVAGDVATTEFRYPDKHADTIAMLVAESAKADPRTAIESAEDVFPADYRPTLGKIDVPTLLLYGEISNMTMPKTGPYMRDAIPEAELVLFKDSGHNPHLEEPERFNQVVSDFANSV